MSAYFIQNYIVIIFTYKYLCNAQVILGSTMYNLSIAKLQVFYRK